MSVAISLTERPESGPGIARVGVAICAMLSGKNRGLPVR